MTNGLSQREMANFIWSICNLLRGPYKRNEYRKVILPLTVLRRFDCLLAPSKDKVLAEHAKVKAKPESVIELKLRSVTGRPFYNLSRLKKSLGNKRRKIGDPTYEQSPNDPDHIEDESAFKGLATSKKKNEKQRIAEIEAGKSRHSMLRGLLKTLQRETTKDGEPELFLDRKVFLKVLQSLDKREGTKLAAPEVKAILSALSERNENAAICRNSQGEPEADSELRDTESVPLKENVEAYFQREVLPHVPEAWIDESKEKVGYEIPLNRHFYRYEPPRELEEIESDIKTLETEIVQLLKEVTA